MISALAPCVSTAYGPDDYLSWVGVNRTVAPQFFDGEISIFRDTDLVRPCIAMQCQDEWLLCSMKVSLKGAGDCAAARIRLDSTEGFKGTTTLAADGASENSAIGRHFVADNGQCISNARWSDRDVAPGMKLGR